MAMPDNDLVRGTLFEPTLVSDLINKVQGRSSLARLAKQTPLAFNGNREFTFTMDSDVSVVAEAGAKVHGGVTIAPVTIVPIKVEYGARVSDEFMYSTEEERINILKAFNDGFAKKVARGLDLMAFHGVNPRAGTASSIIGNNHFDYAAASTVAYNSADPEGNIETAVSAIRAAGGDVSGIIVDPAFSGALAALTNGVGGPKLYPQLAWGGTPDSLNGMPFDINKTVKEMCDDVNFAYIGDFANMFHWGYAKHIPLEVIRYGDPDGAGCDLKNYNQVYIRAEVYLGWGILDANSFARVIQEPSAGELTLTLTGGAAVSLGTTKVAIAPDAGAGNTYLLKRNGTIPRLNTVLENGKDGWFAYTEAAEVPVKAGETIAVVEITTAGKVVKGGVDVVAAAEIGTNA